ncbi:hypothetical protein BDN67DRAFT_985123, partial [Paxillus ammoniavirescens]
MAEVAYTNLEGRAECLSPVDQMGTCGHGRIATGVESGSQGEPGRDRQGMLRLLDLVDFWKMGIWAAQGKGSAESEESLNESGSFSGAQALTTPNEGMYEEQEMWCPVWQGKLNRLTTALRAEALKGMGLGVPPNNNKSVVEAHDTWKRWVAEAGVRKQEAAEKEAAEREVAEREREHVEEEEAARVREMVDRMATDEPLGEELERDKVEEEGTAMVTSPAATPSKKGKGRDPRLAVVIPARKRPFVEAFNKGTKRVEETEADDVEGERVDAAAAREESRGQPRRVIGDHVHRGTDRCEACEERDHEAQWEREVSVTSGVSKSKTRAKGKGKACQVQPERAMSGPSRVPGSSRPWVHPCTISSAAAEVVGADLLEAD